jgi:hypothetical protein
MSVSFSRTLSGARMQRMLASLLAAWMACSLAAVPSEACGDKLLVIGRRVKRVPAAQHPASVLLYMRPGSGLPTAAKEMKLEATLREAGHHVETVDRADQLRSQLAAGRYDFVLTDLPDAAAVAHETGSQSGMPEVVPVAYKAGEAALKSSRESYPLVIQAGKSLSYLSALDSAMRQRQGNGAKP